ncbi:MAG TPA: DUF4861 family protein [Candidatus Hydrogenedentes bacterium]|nr:DUF4861 family protein [Candidatus Hydrogenedentota bacterium]
MRSIVAMTAVMAFGTCLAADENGAVTATFEKVFGEAVRLDPATIARVVSGKPGDRHYVDRNGDGKPEEVWFVDTAPRHPEKWRPVLVRAIDEDGDLESGDEPDFDSDLYVADWHADGTVDAVTDYTDLDGDGDVDEMAFYFPWKNEGLMVWWGWDVGDDNLLWYDIGYTYRQHECQYNCHFGGDELFCAFTLGPNDTEWICTFENPFLFYDLDRDGVTEEVIRFSGRNESVGNLRYSFDADHDATPDNPRDFDVSISAYAPEGLTLDPRFCERRSLRGIPTGPFLRFHIGPQYSRDTAWANYMLTWDENDLNLDGDNLREGRFWDTQERWEGIIAKGNDLFPQIGGPSCGPFNKRYEVDKDPAYGLKIYYTPTDQRLHLFGAETSWMIVDYDYDNQPDMRYEYVDSDRDGYIDTWRLDVDGDGRLDDEWTRGDASVTDIRYVWGEVNAIMEPLLARAPEQLYALGETLRQALAKTGVREEDALQAFAASGFDSPMLDKPLRVRLLSSNESWRYYLDLVKDRLILALKSRHAKPAFWTAFDALRAHGNLGGMRKAVADEFGLPETTPDFNRFRAGTLDSVRGPRVAWGHDWAPPNIAWESERCAYRAYWGQFDFFGKRNPGLVISSFGSGVNYHAEQDWGMDALHVKSTCGLGGVTIHAGGKAYPAYSPNGKGDIAWSKRLVSETPDRVEIELRGEHVGPHNVVFRCAALADRPDSPIDVTVENVEPGEAIEIGVGLERLSREQFMLDTKEGVMASWGIQDPAIGFIGLGILFNPDAFVRMVEMPDQRQAILKLGADHRIRYHIQGDWMNGRRFPRCPNMDNWMDELRTSARTASLKRLPAAKEP